MRMLRRSWLRVWNFVARRNDERRLREEVEQHLFFEIEANIGAGMTPEEARPRGRIKFGPIESVRETYQPRKDYPQWRRFFRI